MRMYPFHRPSDEMTNKYSPGKFSFTGTSLVSNGKIVMNFARTLFITFSSGEIEIELLKNYNPPCEFPINLVPAK
jgi:hypothetical protein